MMATIRLHSAPSNAPTIVIPPYQMARARPIGPRVRIQPRSTSPAKGGTTARTPGRNRLMKMPATPKRMYSRSITAMLWARAGGARCPAKRRRP